MPPSFALLYVFKSASHSLDNFPNLPEPRVLHMFKLMRLLVPLWQECWLKRTVTSLTYRMHIVNAAYPSFPTEHSVQLCSCLPSVFLVPPRLHPQITTAAVCAACGRGGARTSDSPRCMQCSLFKADSSPMCCGVKPGRAHELHLSLFCSLLGRKFKYGGRVAYRK